MIFLAHPRTASVATAEALCAQAGFEKLDPPADHHARLWDRGSPVTDRNRDRWLVFSTVRNHWDAAVSWVCRKWSARGGEPAAWGLEVLRLALDPASNRWVEKHRLWGLHSGVCDRLLRFESLEEELAAVLVSRGLRAASLRRRNVSENRRGRSHRDLLTSEARDYVGQRFRGEIETFGYTF